MLFLCFCLCVFLFICSSACLVLYSSQRWLFNAVFHFLAPQRQFEIAFRMFDINGDGELEASEFDVVR